MTDATTIDAADRGTLEVRTKAIRTLVEQAAASFEIWRGQRPDTASILATLLARTA